MSIRDNRNLRHPSNPALHGDMEFRAASTRPFGIPHFEKHLVHSKIYHRESVADVCTVGPKESAGYLFLLFGGSGNSQENYEQHAKITPEFFQNTLNRVARGGMNFVFIHVPAPYDVPINHLSFDRFASTNWKQHVLTELLAPWSKLPYFVSGFSGGAALALNGLEQEPQCFGGCIFSGDAIPRDFEKPVHWKRPLRLYTSPGDRVAQAPANRDLASSLTRTGMAEIRKLRARSHNLSSYTTLDSLGSALLIAEHLHLEK